MTKEQIEMLILAGDLLVERIAEGETLCEIQEIEFSEEAEFPMQQALLDGLEALRAKLKDYE